MTTTTTTDTSEVTVPTEARLAAEDFVEELTDNHSIVNVHAADMRNKTTDSVEIYIDVRDTDGLSFTIPNHYYDLTPSALMHTDIATQDNARTLVIHVHGYKHF